MILLDFSAVMHQCIFSAISTIKPKEVDGQYETKEFIQYTKYRILEEILNVQNEIIYSEISMFINNIKPFCDTKYDIVNQSINLNNYYMID